MIKSEGDKNSVQYIECINSRQNIWRIRWDIQEKSDNENIVTFMEEEFNHQPSLEEIKSIIIDWYNIQVSDKILSGMRYNGILVWLSLENQFNYKTFYDLAIQTQGQNLPITLKFGTSENPYYYKFNTIEEISNFYSAMVKFISDTLFEGWEKKDSIIWDNYAL